MAFIQAKAIDKRLSRDGSVLFETATIAYNNAYYQSAIDILTYIIDNYKQSPYFEASRNLLLRSREGLIKNTFPIDLKEVRALANMYLSLAKEYGRRPPSAEPLHNTALLFGNYLGKPDSGIYYIQQVLQLTGVDKNFIDKCKLDLGDMYILNGEPWEAVLIYGQVEKSQKDQPLGYEAKLRNAKLSFYKGEFFWAQDQLDVLKTATTREISNDAIALSLLIQDNIAEDSITTPLEMYADAQLKTFMHQYDSATYILKQILVMFKNHRISDEVYFSLANIYLKTGKYAEAEKYLLLILEEYPTDILADDALIQLARMYDQTLKDKQKAMNTYQKLFEEHPASIYSAEARKRYRILRGDKLN